MPHDPYKALYIHIPFCASKCAYCDFASSANSSDTEIASYIEHLVSHVKKLSSERELCEIETIYIGGGTPTYIGNKYLTQLLYAIGMFIHLDGVEFSVEANPDSVDARLIADMWALGVNRLSIGVQAFDDSLLSEAGRIHTSKQAQNAIEIAKSRFDNISIDLMCGLPNQSVELFEDSVDEFIKFDLKHVSVYPLSIEAKTQFYKRFKRNKLNLPSEDEVVEMMKLAQIKLGNAGFKRYEVASYSHSNYECKHNISYWSGVPYIGLGTSASTMTQNSERRMRITDGQVVDDLNQQQMIAEDLMLGMRMSKGVTIEQVKLAATILPNTPSVFEKLLSKNLIALEDERYRPTELGWLFGNELYGEILDLSN